MEKPSREDKKSFFGKMIEDVFSIQSGCGKSQKALNSDSIFQVSMTSKVAVTETESEGMGSQKESISNHNQNVKRRKRKHGSKHKFMAQLEEIEKCYVEQTEGYDIDGLEKLYSDSVKSIIDLITKDHGGNDRVKEDSDSLVVVKKKHILKHLHMFITQRH